MTPDNLIPLSGHRAPLPKAEKPAELQCIEPGIAPEFFSTDLARIFVHGPFVRLVWSSPDKGVERIDDDEFNNIVNVKIVVPTEALQAIYEALGKAIAASAVVQS
jgi:hypothetical protein